MEVEGSRLALVTVPSLHLLLTLAPARGWTGGGEAAPRVTVTGLLSSSILGHTAGATGEVLGVARHTGLALGSSSEVSTVLRKQNLILALEERVKSHQTRPDLRVTGGGLPITVARLAGPEVEAAA